MGMLTYVARNYPWWYLKSLDAKVEGWQIEPFCEGRSIDFVIACVVGILVSVLVFKFQLHKYSKVRFVQGCLLVALVLLASIGWLGAIAEWYFNQIEREPFASGILFAFLVNICPLLCVIPLGFVSGLFMRVVAERPVSRSG